MRLRDKFLSAVLAVSILFPYIFVSGAFASEESAGEGNEEQKLIYEETFETHSIGATTISGLTLNAKSNKVGVVDLGDGNKRFEMSITTENDMFFETAFNTSYTGKYIFEMEVLLKDYGNSDKMLTLYDDKSNSSFLGYFLPDGTYSLTDGTSVAGFITGKSYKVAYGIDTEAKTMDVYFNGKKRLGKYPFINAGIENIAKFRFQFRTPKGHTTLYVDNIRFYKADKPLSDEELEKVRLTSEGGTEMETITAEQALSVMSGSVGLYVGKPNALVKGRKTYITPERNVLPYLEGAQAMLPVRFFAQSIGATVGWNEANQSVVLAKGDTEVYLTQGKSEITVNGSKMGLPKPAANKEGVLYAPAHELCEAFDLYLFCDESGLIVYGEEDLGLDWNKKLSLMRKISESFIYDDVTGEEIYNLLVTKNPNQQHPRLLMTEDKFAAIRAELAKGENGDPVYRAIFESVKQEANSYLDLPPVYYEIADGIRMLPVSRRASARILALSMMYNLTGEEKYAIRCRQELIAVCSFEHWHPYHFLDTGEMTNSVAIGYDWLYHWLDDTDKAMIRRAIVEKGMMAGMDDYEMRSVKKSDPQQTDILSRSRTWYSDGIVSNWNFVCNGGVSMGCLAVADELTGDDLEMAKKILETALLGIRQTISLFAPEGDYEEGIVYWGYANKYYNYHMRALSTALGTDFGYTDAPGLKRTTDYVYAVNGSVSSFNYHDTDSNDIYIEPYVMFWAERFDDPSAARPRIERILNYNDGNVHDFLYYSPTFIKGGEAQLENDSVLTTTGVFSARSGWGDNDTYVGFHADEAYAGSSHDHFDGGIFVLQAMGENFFIDLGKDSYNLPNYYGGAYRTRAEGHNTLTINPDGRRYDQKYAGWSEINQYETKPLGAYAISNLSDLYSELDAESVWRGVKLDNYRRTVTVQDEIVMKRPSEIYWFAHTQADIEISEDGKLAYLTMNGKTLLAEIAEGDGAVFSVMDALPLPQSPNPEKQNKNRGIHKLTIHMTDVTKTNLTVIFNNYDGDYDAESYSREFVPMHEWSIPDGEYERNYAKLSGISVNGKPLPGFDPDVYEYEVEITDEADAFPQVSATADGRTEVQQLGGVSGNAYISAIAHDGLLRKGYTVRFVVPAYVGTPKDKSEIRPVSVTASDVPQPENAPKNTIDGRLDTRWSCNGICWIQYDLGEVHELSAAAIAFMLGEQRTAQFKIELSEDGEHYVTAFEGDSLSTSELETHELFGAKARYIRVRCYGWNGSTNEWNSMTEFKVFKK